MSAALQMNNLTELRSVRAESPRVLVVDDDIVLLRSYARMLASHGYRVETAISGEAAVVAVAAGPFDVILSDIDMPGMSGIELLKHVRRVDLDVPLVLITGNPSLETATQAIEQGALRYLVKPVQIGALADVVGEAVRLHRLACAKREALDLVGGYDKLVGDAAGLVSSFDRALDSMYIAYQPIVAWSTRSVFGYEALLRSREPSLPHPGAVLDAAERLGRTRDVGRVVRERATLRAAKMPPGALLFVNLHTRDLLDEDLYARHTPLAKMADRVVLEMTERASLHQVPDIQGRVAKLRALGYRIAVDDLGAGYAGLTSFALLEPEIVKLDMSLVRGLHKEPTKRTLVRTMITMCRELGMMVVAEGVEVPEEREALREAGCELMQGYLFARPGEPFPKPAW
jgi:EAL domain-containing protein (putative c-di-GMP-specific phosphodiesterase class I)/ActR/RegA family two-component response regulator